MFIDASGWVLEKLKERNISLIEVEECFFNHEGPFLIDDREENRTNPPTVWFISETIDGRRLKVVLIFKDKIPFLKSAYEPNENEEHIYDENR